MNIEKFSLKLQKIYLNNAQSNLYAYGEKIYLKSKCYYFRDVNISLVQVLEGRVRVISSFYLGAENYYTHLNCPFSILVSEVM